MKIIAFEGLDASGKATQTKLLTESLTDLGYAVATTSFPRYNHPIGALILQWLKGEVELTDHAAHMLYEVDRQDFQSYIDLQGKNLDYLVIDRYTLSNLAFGMAKSIDLEWLMSLQSKVVQPDVTFILDVNSKTSHERRPERRDKHETDHELLTRSRAAYHHLAQYVAQHDPNRLIYTLDANGTAEEVHDAILDFFAQGFI